MSGPRAGYQKGASLSRPSSGDQPHYLSEHTLQAGEAYLIVQTAIFKSTVSLLGRFTYEWYECRVSKGGIYESWLL